MILPVLVTAALCYAQMGYLLRFEAQRVLVQRSIKDRIRKGVPKEQLTRFVMPRTEWEAMNWVKPAREFRLPNGDMYDVVYLQEKNDVIDALCIHDRDETLLFAGLKEHVRRTLDGPDPRGGTRDRIMRMLVQLDLPPQRMDQVVAVETGTLGFLTLPSLLQDGVARLPDPPPWVRWSVRIH